jgi:serine-threonine kinase receptor-associated protein
VWDTYTGDNLATLPHNHVVRSADISSSQSLVATGGVERSVKIYDLGHNQDSNTIGSHEGTIKSVVWDHGSLNDTTIITSGDDKRIVWWDTRSARPSADYITDEMISSMEQSNDRKYVIVTAGKSLLVFSTAT